MDLSLTLFCEFVQNLGIGSGQQQLVSMEVVVCEQYSTEKKMIK